MVRRFFFNDLFSKVKMGGINVHPYCVCENSEVVLRAYLNVRVANDTKVPQEVRVLTGSYHLGRHVWDREVGAKTLAPGATADFFVSDGPPALLQVRIGGTGAVWRGFIISGSGTYNLSAL